MPATPTRHPLSTKVRAFLDVAVSILPAIAPSSIRIEATGRGL